MKIALVSLVVLLGLLLLLGSFAYAIGRSLPQSHTAAVVVELGQPAEAVWKRIADMQAGPSWRRGLRSVERRPDREGRAVWRETQKNGDALDFETVREEPPRELVRRMVGEGLPFGGTWTMVLEALGDGGSRLTITENGEVYNPLFRFVSKYVMGHDATLRAYAEDLRQSFR